jgi:hypothetical protein
MIIESKSEMASHLRVYLGLALLLFFFASIAPTGAVISGNTCDGIVCDPCVKNPATEKCQDSLACYPINRVLYNGRMTIVYAWFKKGCCTFQTAAVCQHQDLCTTNGECEVIGDTYTVPCKGTTSSCSDWQIIPGSIRYGSCGLKPT